MESVLLILLLTWQLAYNMNQSFSRIGPAPARYSSRKPIFEGPSGIYQIQSPYEQEEVFKIVAKIRSLEDDVRAIQE